MYINQSMLQVNVLWPHYNSCETACCLQNWSAKRSSYIASEEVHHKQELLSDRPNPCSTSRTAGQDRIAAKSKSIRGLSAMYLEADISNIM
jgi:hypothetical protein